MIFIALLSNLKNNQVTQDDLYKAYLRPYLNSQTVRMRYAARKDVNHDA